MDFLKSVKYITMSSAYNEILLSNSLILIPEMSLLFLIVSAKGSIAKLNKNGDKGQPWRHPLVKEK